MTAASFVELFRHKAIGNGAVLLAAEDGPDETSDRVWIAVSGTLRAISVDGRIQVEKRLPFQVRFLKTVSNSVIVAGQEGGIEVLDGSGQTKIERNYTVRALCAAHERFAFCAKDHPNEIYIHPLSSPVIEKVLTLSNAVSGIALKENLVAAAHSDINQISIWNIDESKQLYTIPVGPCVEKLSFGLQPEEFFVWRSDDQVLVRYNRDNWVATIPAGYAFLNRHAIFYGNPKEECTLEWVTGSCPVMGVKACFIAGVATPGWIAAATDGHVFLYDIVNTSPLDGCTIS